MVTNQHISYRTGRATSLRAMAKASRRLSEEPDPARGLWSLVCALREDLSIDRAGVFSYDVLTNTLDRVVGVDPDGQPEYSGESLEVNGTLSPFLQVARRELPCYFTDDVRRDYPHLDWSPRARALAVIPIIAGDEFLGILCADNYLTGKPMPASLLEPLFLYAGLAALPLFALYQKKERCRVEAMRRNICREVLYSVTSGKIRLCDQCEISGEWPAMDDPIPIRKPEDVRAVRETVRRVSLDAGMDEQRVEDLGLCASEAAANALLHGSGGAAVVRCISGRLRIRVEDQGTGIATEDIPRATLLKGWSSRASLGLGYTIMHETADRMYLYTGPDGTTLIVEMAVQPEAESLEDFNPLVLWEDAVPF
jgi:anti-sigma regulatory factor (Ser/Thr protein kinase)